MLNYVVGFILSKDKREIVLMEKQKPQWQKGKFNGIGGKANESEHPYDAMRREFKEETGVDLEREELHLFALLKFKEINLFCFRGFTDKIYDCRTIEAEEVLVMKVKTALASKTIIPNLKVLIPMAIDEEFEYADIDAVVR